MRRTKTILTKFVAIVLCTVFMLPVTKTGIFSSQALSPTYTVSNSYSSSSYYTALCNVTLTGNQRTDIVAVAQSQYGYHEGNNSSQLNGNYSGDGNYTEYGYWYGLQDAWCAMFVSWCAQQANISSSIIPKISYVPDYNKSSSGLTIKKSNYTPKPGDLFFTTSWFHVGIVASVSGSTFTTIEGNSSNCVTSHTYSIGSYYFGVPNYESTYTEPPTKPVIQLDKHIALIDQDVTISFSSERANSYWVGIYSDDVLFSQSRVYGNTYTVNYPWVGKYDVVVVAENNCGDATGYSSFRVGHEGDYPIENFSVSCNKTVALKNTDVVFSFHADNAENYWIGVYTSGGYLYDQALTTENTYSTQCPWTGDYSVVIVAQNECSSSTKYINLSVVEASAPPTVPTVTVNKKVGLVNEDIIISFFAQDAFDYWVGIYKDGDLWEDANVSGNIYTSSFSYVGEYRVAVVARNSSGSTTGYASFKIGREGDYVPNQLTASIDNTVALKNEPITISFSADNADCYWVGVSKDGTWLTRENVYSNTITVSYSELGEYKVAIVAMNDCSSSNGFYLSFHVVEQREFSICYDANGGIDAPESGIKTYGKSYTLSKQPPNKIGYTFSGWNTQADGKGTNYAPGASYTAEADVTLYAQWIANTPAVNPATGSGVVVDESAHFIYGLSAGGAQGCVAVTDGTAAYEYSNAKQALGTGTKVNVYNNDNVFVDSYTIVVFGDIDGDSWYDGTDAYFVRLVASGMVSANMLTDAQRTACDVNHDGAIDTADAAILEQAGLLLSEIDQTLPSEELQTNSAYQEYCSLIDQSVEITEPDQPTAEEPAPIAEPEPQPATQSVWGWLKTLFTIVLNWLLRVF